MVGSLRRVRRLRRTSVCVLVPAAERGYVRALFIANGRVAAERILPPGAGARVEVEAGLATTRANLATDCWKADELDELLLIDGFLRRPPPELRVAPLDLDEILRRAVALQAQAEAALRPPSRARAA